MRGRSHSGWLVPLLVFGAMVAGCNNPQPSPPAQAEFDPPPPTQPPPQQHHRHAKRLASSRPAHKPTSPVPEQPAGESPDADQIVLFKQFQDWEAQRMTTAKP